MFDEEYLEYSQIMAEEEETNDSSCDLCSCDDPSNCDHNCPDCQNIPLPEDED